MIRYILSQIASVLLLPFNVLISIPLIIVYTDRSASVAWGLSCPAAGLFFFLAFLFILGGLCLLVTTIQLFIKKGRGTLAPWNPTKNLVISGPYRYVRNPMISGVMMVLLGEALLLGSIFVFGWLLLFFLLNHAYITLVEEPGLVKRFGREYEKYRNNVPKWIPRLTPWPGGG